MLWDRREKSGRCGNLVNRLAVGVLLIFREMSHPFGTVSSIWNCLIHLEREIQLKVS